VLVIEDDLDIGDSVKESLEKNGFNVHVFNDPLLALDYFKLNPKENSLVISNIGMPGMNGMEFVAKIMTISIDELPKKRNLTL
jgi:DNA-binding response OmpR family regulator